MDRNIYCCGMFDEECEAFMEDRDYNLAYLKAIEHYCNDVLKVQGHISLYEVLIRIDSSWEERLSDEEKEHYKKCGWSVDDTEDDNFVYFDLHSSEDDPAIFFSFNL